MTSIGPKTRWMGLVGEKIEKSLSPLIHNTSAALLGRDCVYLCFPVSEAKLSTFFEMAWDLGAVGFNVTSPHKTRAAQIIKNSDRNSINTIYRGANGWLGTSTDGVGFGRALAAARFDSARYTKVVILGSGGVVPALIEYFVAAIPHTFDVVILRRNVTAQNLIEREFGGRVRLKFIDFNPESLRSSVVGDPANTLVVQASSAPLHGDDLASFVPALSGFAVDFIDLGYSACSALLGSAIANGARAMDGLSMLIEQARASQELWWGASAPAAHIRSAITAFTNEKRPST